VNFSHPPKSNVAFKEAAHHAVLDVVETSLTLIGLSSNSISPKKFPSGLGPTPGPEFIPMTNGDVLVGSIVVDDVSGSKTMVFPTCAGALHEPLGSSIQNDGNT